ncbi:pilus assembly protein TadG-related protein [Glaciihabitans tibetensis]|uniref:pilus assembly protein TadG-related protein n=1 Tax=Glaciihabitans tibetensis TaxID=1266600 RepID=UPI001FE3ADB3|nr:pilus assembly protein TadG-related protein [Glaciihabitans tibetensis]
MIIAVAMVALFGFVAIVIDVGALYAERGQLQNGADAAALAIAQDCADGTCTNTPATAQLFANANANDSAARATVSGLTTSSVTVSTATVDGETGAGALALSFAPVLGIDSKAVAATATAGWGSPLTGPAVIGMTFAPCVFALNGAIQVISMHGDSGGNSCTSTSPSGQVLPGGFGWLKDNAGQCQATVTAGTNTTVSGSTGVSLPPGCQALLSSMANETILLPVYSDRGGTGASAFYKIRGWAAFRLLGWNFPGFSYHNATYPGANCKGSCKGIVGQFISFVSLDDRFTRGGPNLGTSVVELTR